MVKKRRVKKKTKIKNLNILIVSMILAILLLGIYFYSDSEEVGKLIQNKRLTKAQEKPTDLMTQEIKLSKLPSTNFFQENFEKSQEERLQEKVNAYPRLLYPVNKELINENDCNHVTEGLDFIWTEVGNAEAYLFKVKDTTGQVYEVQLTESRYHFPVEGCSSIPEGEYEWWVKPIINGQIQPPSKRNKVSYEKFTADYPQLKYILTNKGCSGQTDIGITLPDSSQGEISWGYMLLNSEDSLFSTVGDYELIEEGNPYPDNTWVYLNGEINPEDRISFQVLYDLVDPSQPDQSMINTFENAQNILMPRNVNRWPDELNQYLADSTTIQKNWINENYRDETYQRNLVKELGDYIKVNDLTYLQVIDSVRYIVNARSYTYDSPKVHDAFDLDGKTTTNYINHIRNTKEVYEDKKFVCNSMSRYICSIFRAVGVPCMTKTSASMHMDPAIWIPYSNKQGKYSLNEGQWIYLGPGIQPYEYGGLVETRSFSSSNQDYFNVMWYPECSMNLKYRTSVDNRLDKENIKLIFVVPGKKSSLNPTFLSNLKAKGDDFFLHHLLPSFSKDERWYIWQPNSNKEEYKIEIINKDLNKVKEFNIDLSSGEIKNKKIESQDIEMILNIKKYKGHLILEVKKLGSKKKLN